jgi:hypothetical protein
MATTYSRGSYTATTIGPAAFDGRVRNGNGSDHCGIVTKNFLRTATTACAAFVANFNRAMLKNIPRFRAETDHGFGHSLKTTHRITGTTIRELKLDLFPSREPKFGVVEKN